MGQRIVMAALAALVTSCGEEEPLPPAGEKELAASEKFGISCEGTSGAGSFLQPDSFTWIVDPAAGVRRKITDGRNGKPVCGGLDPCFETVSNQRVSVTGVLNTQRTDGVVVIRNVKIAINRIDATAQMGGDYTVLEPGNVTHGDLRGEYKCTRRDPGQNQI